MFLPLEMPTVTPSPDQAPQTDLVSVPDSNLVPIPSSFQSTPQASSSLTPLVCDERAISSLLASLLSSSGLSMSEAARRLGMNAASIRQYINGRRGRPGLLWFVKFAGICGARVTIDFPPKGAK